MKISIAMATYNGAEYLDAQLESILTQSRLPDELIITDDQSTDATANIVETFAARAPFTLHFEVNPCRLGVTLNFDRALGLCTGDLILLSDQDDVWFHAKIETLEQAAKLHPNSRCFINDALLTNRTLQPVGTTKMGQIEAIGLPATAMVQGCCTAFHRELMECLLPIPPDQQAHDNWLVQMADLLAQTMRLQEPLQYYRRHGGNVSNSTANRLVDPGYLQRQQEKMAGILRRMHDPDGLNAEYEFYASAAQRLIDRQPELAACVGSQRLEVARSIATSRSQLLANRKAIRSMPRMRRPGPVLKLWRNGDYGLSGHAVGALKDLLVAPIGKSGTR